VEVFVMPIVSSHIDTKPDDCRSRASGGTFAAVQSVFRTSFWSLVNEALCQKAPAQGAEIEIAPAVAEALDDAAERRSRSNTHQCAQRAQGADVARGKHVNAAQATQQHYPGAPGADARQLGQSCERILRAHARNILFAQRARLDRPREVPQRLGFSGAQATLPQCFEASLGDGPGRGVRMEAAAAVLEMLAEAFDQPAHNGHASIQAQLLERDHVRERLE